MDSSSRNNYGGIRKQILTSMILVPAVPFILILGIGYFYFSTSLTNTGMASVNRIVSDHRHMIESFLLERKADLEFVLDAYPFEALASEQVLGRVFEQLQRKSTAFSDLGVFDANGVHLAYCGPYKLSGKVYADAKWFQEVLKRGHYISDVFLGYRKIPHFIIAVVREENNRKGVIRATIDTRSFNELVGKVRIGKSGEAYILTRNGFYQTERRSGGILMEKDPDFPDYPKLHDGTQVFFYEDLKGEVYLYATTLLKEKDWILVVRQEKADAFKALKTASWLIVFIGILGGGVIVALAFYLTTGIVARLKRADTEKERIHDQLIRAGRLAELGEMAAGFAHEINNPLQIMKSEQALINTIMADWKAKHPVAEIEKDLEELEESVDQIALQIDRCSKITHAILKFGRQTDPEVTRMDLRRFIPEITALVDKKAQVHGVRVDLDISPETPCILGDPAQFQQVLLNLFNNALDAVIAKHGPAGGSIQISTRPHAGRMVEVRVTDNGGGIDPENMKKVFSPFFTTKPVGEGTGLGLSICYGIITSMEGTMKVSSEPGQGTTFTIQLPMVEDPPGT